MKFVNSDYVEDPTTHAKLGFRAQMVARAHSGEIYTPGVYFFFLYFFNVLAHLHRSHCRS